MFFWLFPHDTKCVPFCCLQVFGTDLSRKKDVIGIFEKVAAVVLQDAPSP